METVGTRIRRLRMKNKMSRQEFRNALGLPSSSSLVYMWESDRVIPSSINVIVICETFGVSADWLLGVRKKTQ